MKTYVFRPHSHGPVSFIVTAASEREAREAVDAKLFAWSKEEDMDEEWLEREYKGAGTEEAWRKRRYELTILELGQIMTHAND